MKNVSLVAQHEGGDTKNVKQMSSDEVLVDRPRYSSKTK